MSLLISAVALSTVVWVGKYGAKAPALVVAEKKAKDAPTVDDLPMPASGPLGKIEVSELQFNFGTKSVGDKDQHTFTIKNICLLYTSPSPRDGLLSRMPSSA